MNSSSEVDDRLRKGDKSAINEAIANYTSLAYKIASKYIAWNDRRVVGDEYESVAMFALVRAVNWVCEGRVKHDNVVGYIIQTIRSHILAAIAKDNAFNNNRLEKKYKGKIIGYDSWENSDDCAPGRNDIPFDVIDLLKEITKDDFDKQVITLRMEGYSDAEIAKKLDCRLLKVFRQRKELYRRYKEMGG